MYRVYELTDEEKDIIIEINSRDISKLYANKKEYFNEFSSSRKGKTFVNFPFYFSLFCF